MIQPLTRGSKRKCGVRHLVKEQKRRTERQRHSAKSLRRPNQHRERGRESVSWAVMYESRRSRTGTACRAPTRIRSDRSGGGGWRRGLVPGGRRRLVCRRCCAGDFL